VSGPLDILVSVLAPDAAAGAYNDWELVATTTLPGWVQVGLLIVAAAALVGSFVGLGRISRSKRLTLFVLRALAAAWIVALVMQPAIELRAVSRVRTRVALAVDTSRSMSLATPKSSTLARPDGSMITFSGLISR